MQSRAPNCNLRHHNAAQGTKLQPGTSQISPGHHNTASPSNSVHQALEIRAARDSNAE